MRRSDRQAIGGLLLIALFVAMIVLIALHEWSAFIALDCLIVGLWVGSWIERGR